LNFLGPDSEAGFPGNRRDRVSAPDPFEKIGHLDFVSIPAAADWDASFTMERVNFLDNIAKAFLRKRAVSFWYRGRPLQLVPI
jgi:hypothetical protein